MKRYCANCHKPSEESRWVHCQAFGDNSSQTYCPECLDTVVKELANEGARLRIEVA